MEYEYNEAKSRKNYEERGIDFEFVSRIFDGDYIEQQDQRHEYGERRFIAIGRIGGSVFVVVYACRAGRRRIISTLRANRRERDVYSKESTRGRVDWRPVDATTDEDINRQISEDPDTAPESTEEDLDEAWIVHSDGTRERYRDRVPQRDESTRG